MCNFAEQCLVVEKLGSCATDETSTEVMLALTALGFTLPVSCSQVGITSRFGGSAARFGNFDLSSDNGQQMRADDFVRAHQVTSAQA